MKFEFFHLKSALLLFGLFTALLFAAPSTINAQEVVDKTVATIGDGAVSYTHLTLPTNREV